MNLGDPELELIDPTPNVHALFIQFDRTFFWAKLASRVVVRWSKRMYSCAGICSYEGRGGLCDIAISEPLLKLRPRKDLVETLLHEMIHAFLFITQRDQDRDGHGPNFKEHMYRINKAAGINISIYHDFHDEVKLYQTHWWRCNGSCQLRKPYFGIVRRFTNTAPGPRERWWEQHQRSCGGTFIKIKEPEKTNRKTPVAQRKGDITKYITSNKKTTTGESRIVQITNIKSSTVQVPTKSNNSSTMVVTQKGVSNPINKPAVKPPSFVIGKYYTIGGTSTRVRSNSVDAAEAVRNVWSKKQLTPSTGSASAAETVRNTWAKKQLTPAAVSPIVAVKEKINNHVQKPTTLNVFPKTASTNMNNNDLNKKIAKHKAQSEHVDSPPGKVKKIDDYFKKNATALLKDIYGINIEVAESSNNNKLVAVNNTGTSSSHTVRVDCPICALKIEEQNINSHLDECLNKDFISKISSGNETAATCLVKTESVPLDNNNKDLLNPTVGNKASKQVSKEILATLQTIPTYKPKLFPKQESEIKREIVTTFRGTFCNETEVINEPNNLDDNIDWKKHLLQIPKIKLEPIDLYKAESVVKKVQFDKPLSKSDNFTVPNEEKGGRSGHPFIVGDAKVKLPEVKKEPGTGTVSVLPEQNCPCCGSKVTKPMDEHLDECLAFFATDTAPEEASTSIANQTIVIDDDDDDLFDESQVFNATGTKLPCPCCMQMVENDDMNAHLDSCLT